MTPTADDPTNGQDMPVYMLPDGTILSMTDAHGQPVIAFDGMPVGTGPHGEIVLLPSGWSGNVAGAQWTPFSGMDLGAAGPAPASLFGGLLGGAGLASRSPLADS